MHWQEFISGPAAEYIATAAAVASVVLIARQNILGWPLGILWAVISAWLAFSRWHLISESILYATYVPIQIYCWLTWSRPSGNSQVVPPTWLPRRLQIFLLIAVIVSVLLWGWGVMLLSEKISWIAPPALLWRDTTTTVINYFAQFLQARKRMENWGGWLIVNVLGIHIYTVKGSPIYAMQYGFFLLLGLYGWWSWRRTMKEAAA